MISHHTIIAEDLMALLDLSPSPWDKLRGARLFITGGTGLFGRWILESLIWANDHLNLGAEVTVLVREPEIWRNSVPHLAYHSSVKIQQGDLLTFKFPDEYFSHIMHLAAPSGPSQQCDPLGLLDILVNGTRRVLDLAVHTNTRRFLFVSSGAVYGRHAKPIQKIDENCRDAPDQMDPASCYDEGKRAAELLCALYQHQKHINIIVARCFSVLGPFLPLDWHYAAGNFIRDALSGETILVKGDGTPERSYLYLADLAWWLWVILVNGQFGRAYNVGGDEVVSIAELAQRVADCCSLSVQVEITQKPQNRQMVQRYVPCLRRVREELGLKPRVNLNQALKRTLAFYSR